MNPTTPAADATASTIVSSPYIQWVTQHWLLVLICVILFLILLIGVIIPMIAAICARRKKNYQVSDLKKELTVWKNLSSLARGGDDAAQAKQNLTAKLQLLNTLFEEGQKLFGDRRIQKTDVPWFLMLGEPRSGQNTMLKNSGIDFVTTNNPQAAYTDSAPITSWLASKAFVISVSGRIFFDRWMEGSSAEWERLLTLIKSKHKRMPLNGIIFTIPADALLADDENLTRQKSALVGTELYRCVSKLGLNLPCHVVITKLDMLQGFKEYFDSLSEDERFSCFGWENPNAQGHFTRDQITEYLDNTYEYLQQTTTRLIQRPELYSNTVSRQDIASKIYLLPENFNAMRKNLLCYLNALFGSDGWLGHDRVPLNGVFFTSSLNNGITFSQTYATLLGKKLEEAPINAHTRIDNNSYFSHDLLLHRVFTCPRSASYTTVEQVRRLIPFYIVCILLLALSGFWLMSAFVKHEDLSKSVKHASNYYAKVSESFAAGDISNAPLVEKDDKNTPRLLVDATMPHSILTSRLEFIHNNYQQIISSTNSGFAPMIAPWGCKLAALALFGAEPVLGYDKQCLVSQSIAYHMVFQPTTMLLSDRFLHPIANEPFTRVRFLAGYSFCRMDVPQLDKRPLLSDMLSYLFPDINYNTLSLLTYENADARIFNKNWAKTVYSYDYTQAKKAFLQQLFKAWSKLNIYPETKYPIFKETREKTLEFAVNQQKLGKIYNDILKNPANQEQLLKEIKKIKIRQKELHTSLCALYKKLILLGCFPKLDLQEDKLLLPPISYTDFSSSMSKAYDEYVATFEEDFASMLPIYLRVNHIEESDATLENVNSFKMNIYSILENERKDFEREMRELVNYGMLTEVPPPSGDKKATSINQTMLFQVLGALDSISCDLPDITPFKHLTDFASQWDRQLHATDKISQQMDQLLAPYNKVPAVQNNAQVIKKITALQANNNMNKLLNALAKTFPNNSEKMASWIRSIKVTPEKMPFSIPETIVKESIGDLSLPPVYVPYAAMTILKPYAHLQEYVVSAKKKNNSITIQLDSLKETDKLIKLYLKNYLNFWQTYPDKLHREVASWSEFRTLCVKLKPFEINLVLNTVYNASADVLADVPSVLLNKEQIKTRDATVSDYRNRGMMLGSHLSDLCTQQLANWATLSERPEVACAQLQLCTDKELLNGYFMLSSTGTKADIPWWSSFIKSGMEHMKQETIKNFLGNISNSSSYLFKFPLCADSIIKEVASDAEIMEAMDRLKSMGISATSPQEKIKAKDIAKAIGAEAAKVNQGLELLKANDLNSQLPAECSLWGQKMAMAIDAIANKDKLLVWTMSLPNASKQQQLTELTFPDLPLALLRFRYMELYSGDNVLQERTQLTSADIKELARGDINHSDLKFVFTSYTANNKNSAISTIDGRWAILRLYLNKNAYVDPEKKTTYVPIFVTDPEGRNCIMWLGLQFNKQLPLPNEWPSTVNWPAFSEVQASLKKPVISEKVLWQQIIQNEKYEKLKTLFLRDDVRKYPKLDIRVAADAKLDSELFLKYRYVEVAVPGQPIERRTLKRGVSLGSYHLATPIITLRFYRHTNDIVPACSLSIDGPYAPLRLLTTKGRKIKKNVMDITIQDQVMTLPLTLQFSGVQ